MSLKYCILAAEGSHDQAVLCSLLRMHNMKSFTGDPGLLDTFWLKLVPKNTRGNLYKKLDVPYFFTSLTHSVAVYQGDGSKLAQNISDILSANKPYVQDIYALGIIVDADNNQPGDVAQNYVNKLRAFFPRIAAIPGTVSPGSPRTGIYVLPDNKKQGTLDSVFVNCANNVYPDHKAGATQFLDGLDAAHKSHWKPFDREKAIIASIVSVLQPGIASHLSLARSKDKWVGEQTVNSVPELTSLQQFLTALLDLPPGKLIVSSPPVS